MFSGGCLAAVGPAPSSPNHSSDVYRPSVRRLLAGDRKRLIVAVVGGILCQGAFKLYLFVSDRPQFEDSNLLVSAALVLIAAGLIYLILLASSALASFRKPGDVP